jgi:hypothetical protein
MDDAIAIARLRFHPHRSETASAASSTWNHNKAAAGKNHGNATTTSVIKSDMTEAEDDGFIDLHLARGFAMLHQWSQCNHHLNKVETMIHSLNTKTVVASSSITKSASNGGNGVERESGGRRSKFTSAGDEGRDNSNINFRNNRHEVDSFFFFLTHMFVHIIIVKLFGSSNPTSPHLSF